MDDHAHLRLAADAGLCPEPLDFHPGDPGARKLLFNVGPDGQILLDESGHVLRVPPRLPIADDPDPQPYRMDLLPHAVTSTNLPSLPGLPSLPSLHSHPSLPAWSLDCGDSTLSTTLSDDYCHVAAAPGDDVRPAAGPGMHPLRGRPHIGVRP